MIKATSRVRSFVLTGWGKPTEFQANRSVYCCGRLGGTKPRLSCSPPPSTPPPHPPPPPSLRSRVERGVDAAARAPPHSAAVPDGVQQGVDGADDRRGRRRPPGRHPPKRGALPDCGQQIVVPALPLEVRLGRAPGPSARRRPPDVRRWRSRRVPACEPLPEKIFCLASRTLHTGGRLQRAAYLVSLG